MSVSAGHGDVVQELIGAGADVNEFVTTLTSSLSQLRHPRKTDKGLTPLSVFRPFDVKQTLGLKFFAGIMQLQNLV